MQMPGVQDMLQSPALDQAASSPALAQMMGSLFSGGQGRGRGAGAARGPSQPAGGVAPQGEGMPDLGALFQSMMPIAQQVPLHPHPQPPSHQVFQSMMPIAQQVPLLLS